MAVGRRRPVLTTAEEMMEEEGGSRVERYAELVDGFYECG